MTLAPSQLESDCARIRQHQLARVAQQLQSLAREMLRFEKLLFRDQIPIHPQHLRSARNLAHYLVLRRHDLRKLQADLASVGLSSLGRSEAHVLSTLQNVHRLLCSAISCRDDLASLQPPVNMKEGEQILAQNTRSLLGPLHKHRGVGVMVTMPTSAATDYNLVRNLVQNGMDCMRINCAHDNPDIWSNMIRNLERARQETGRRCKVQIDLAGPKLRTGPIQPGLPALRCRPRRDGYGRVTHPAQIWLIAPNSAAPPDGLPSLTLPAAFLARLHPNDRLRFRDARKSSRTLRILQYHDGRALAVTGKTCYFTTGIQLTHLSRDHSHKAPIGPIPAQPQRLQLMPGDTLILHRSCRPGSPAQQSSSGRKTPAQIGVTLPAMLQHARPGQAIWFDDGKIGGIIRTVSPSRLRVEVTLARPTGEWLGEAKGINLPDTRITMPSLTTEDIRNLEFVAAHADILGYSFVRTPGDVRRLIAHLRRLKAESLPIVLKIETREAFNNLPAILLEAMQVCGLGVMIARGDLAIECGYQRLAEVQEQILWICEAAHLPVIWATQVLDVLARKGIPSRAEITDAAMAERAECVMLNKGPYITEAVRALDDILTRMQAHQEKKRSMLRRLSIACAFALDQRKSPAASAPRSKTQPHRLKHRPRNPPGQAQS
jgi:pyruvate kinase